MAFSHLSMETESYQIFLNNFEQENGLTEENFSSAGSWEVTLDKNIDLSKLLYMKSSSAEIAVSHYTCDHLPIAASRFEKVEMKFFMPPSLGKCNYFFTNYYVESIHNKRIYEIPLEDFSTSEVDTFVSFINSKISLPMITFLVRSILEPVLDTQIFLPEDSTLMSKDDVRIIKRYIDIALFTRHTVHDFLCAKAGVSKGNMKSKIKFQQIKFFTAAEEEKLLKKSNTLRKVEDRPVSSGGHMVNLPLFYGLDLSTLYSKPDGPEHKILTDCQEWITEMDELEYVIGQDGNRKLSDKSLTFLQSLIDANKALIEQAIKAHTTLDVISERTDRRAKLAIESTLVTLKINEGDHKLICDFHSKDYLVNDGTNYTIFFPKLVSRSLGSHGKFSIGPISLNVNETLGTQTTFTNNIKNEHQRLPSQIRPMPKLLYLASSLINPPTCDLWLKNTPYKSCRIMDSFLIDDATISNRFITKTNGEYNYHKLTTRSLDSFVFHIVDEWLQPVYWQQKTYVKLGLKIKPMFHNSS